MTDDRTVATPSLVFERYTPPRFRTPHTTFLHCSASDNPLHDDVTVIRSWHLLNGWKDVGYHFYIKKNGNIQVGRSVELTPAAQVGFNTGTLAICLGGLNTFSEEQFITLRTLCKQINAAHRQMRFRGHKEVDKTRLCPVYDYKTVLNLDENGYIKA
jgi:hypothetical protein